MISKYSCEAYCKTRPKWNFGDYAHSFDSEPNVAMPAARVPHLSRRREHFMMTAAVRQIKIPRPRITITLVVIPFRFLIPDSIVLVESLYTMARIVRVPSSMWCQCRVNS